jgi:hypothetical protein
MRQGRKEFAARRSIEAALIFHRPGVLAYRPASKSTLLGSEYPGFSIPCPRGESGPGRRGMSAAPPIAHPDAMASKLWSFASKCGHIARVRRLLALALALESRSRAEAAQ